MTTEKIYKDDITDELNAKPRTFSIGLKKYTIDLTEENYEKLLNDLKPWTTAGKSSKAKPPIAAERSKTAAIRKWAEANGFSVEKRGRFSTEIKVAYAAAQDTD